MVSQTKVITVILPERTLTSLTSSAIRTRILEARGGKILIVSQM